MEDKYDTTEHEETVYSEQGREDSVEGGEISPQEDAFMAGYEKADESEEKQDDGYLEDPK